MRAPVALPAADARALVCVRSTCTARRTPQLRVQAARQQVACASSREEGLQQMQQYKQQLAQALKSKEAELKAGGSAAGRSVATAAAGGADTATATALREVTKDDFQQCLDDNKDSLVVVDCYTDWCGPCKLMLPQLEALHAELAPAVQVVKFNCNAYNKELGKALGIKVAPTFFLYKGGVKVAQMTGAKIDELRALVDKHK